MTSKYRSKSEFLGEKRSRLIKLSLLTNPLLSSDMCFDHVSLFSMVSPNILELKDHFMKCWLIFKLPKGPIRWFRLRITTSHFLGCGTRELCLHQRASSSRALFSVVVTWSTDSPTQYMVVSSVYMNVVAVITAFGRSLVYKAKSMGPSTETCGIPRATLVFSEGTPLITVYCSRSAMPISFPWFQSCAPACEEGLSVKRNQTPSGSQWIRRLQLICYRLLVAKFQSGGWVKALSIFLFGRPIGCQWQAFRFPRKHVC